VEKWLKVAETGVKAVYYGEYQTVLDEKGRITVPSRFRETMRTLKHLSWYMARGFDGAITLYTQAEWDDIREEAKKHPTMDPAMLAFRRLFFGSAGEVQPDPQGRMPVPANLRQYAGIQREVVLLGLDDRLELWSKSRWEAFSESKDSEFKLMAEKLIGKSLQERERAGLTEKGLSSHED
jgi:MraZ protein